jgi:dolichol-phosphate mannosyltransferase
VLTLSGLVHTSTQLWVLASVLFLGGVQLISIGILGRYLARVHEQSLERPLYLVSRVLRSGRLEPGDERPPPGGELLSLHEETGFTTQ